MKASIFKIFILYWVLMLGVSLTSDLIEPLQMRRYPVIRQAIHSAIRLPAQQQVEEYEVHGCDNFTHPQSGDFLFIADTDGTPLCLEPGISGLNELAVKVRGSSRVLARRFDNYQVVGISMKSQTGREYI